MIRTVYLLSLPKASTKILKPKEFPEISIKVRGVSLLFITCPFQPLQKLVLRRKKQSVKQCIGNLFVHVSPVCVRGRERENLHIS